MLLKASEIKYLELTTVTDEDEDILVSDFSFEEDFEEEDDVVFGQTILLGVDETRFIDEEELAELESFSEHEDIEELEYDEESGVFIGKTVVIGGDYSQSYQQESFEPEEFIEESYSEVDDIQSLLNEDDFSYSDSEEEQEKRHISEEEGFVDDFSSAVNSLEKDLEEGVSGWTMNIRPTPNDSAYSLLSNYKSSAGVRNTDFRQREFISDIEKDNILAESAQLISQAQDFETMTKVTAEMDQKIRRIIERNSEKYKSEVWNERNNIIEEVSEHIEAVLSRHRENIQKESEDHIAKAINFYKEKMNQDSQLLNAANNIIARKEQILEEAYSRSLKLIEEADEQANRIIDDAMAASRQAERIIEEAKIESKRIEQRFFEEAEQVVADANIESARIIQAAEEQHQEIVESATQDGFNVGYQEGREEAIKENAQLLMDTTNALNALHSAFPVAVKENEGKLIKIAIKIADAFTKEEVASRPEICVKILDRAIRRVSDLERVLIKVNPLDLDYILPKEGHFKGILSDVEDFIITGHYSISRGGCTIETNSGTVDAQFATQLRVVEELFNKIRSEYDEAEDESTEEEAA